MKLKGRVVLVTGGGRGIGKAISLALSEAGATVVLTYYERRETARNTVDEIISVGGKAETFRVDVRDRAAVAAGVQMTREHGSLDILINNAGISQLKPFDQITDDDWTQMMAVNLQGAFMCCQEALPHMLNNKWGRIINIASIGGQWGGKHQVHYAVSKAGLICLTRSLARIYSNQGITINAISPGLVRTELSAGELDSKEVRNIPVGRIGTVEEIAQTAVFLASEEASYITGQTINVNGGMYFG